MKISKKTPAISCLIISSILLLSCGASNSLRNDVTYKDSKFSYDNLQKNGMIIGGLSSQFIYLSHEERIEYSSDFSNLILEKLKDAHTIHIINPLQFIDKIGRDNYFNIMENFDKKKTLDDVAIHIISDSISGEKYILLGYIEQENIIDDSYSEDVIDNNEKSIETEYKKTYLLTVDFQIYDLPLGKIVWSNRIYNKATRSETRSTRSGCVEGCMDSVIQTLLFGTPAEIDREEVLAKIYAKLAKDLAKI